MAGISSLFSTAAKAVEFAPTHMRLAVGALGGGALGAMTGNPDESLEQRIARGMVLGGVAGLAAPAVMRLGGAGAETGVGGFINKIKKQGTKFNSLRAANPGAKGLMTAMSAFNTASNRMIAGAGVGALVAPRGHKLQGAGLGASIGLAGPSIYRAGSAWNKIPSIGQSALLGSLAVPIAGYGIIKGAGSLTSIAGVEENGINSYQPMTNSMADRMNAMNASGDIVLGLHNRQHG